MSERTSVLIAEDHPMFRGALEEAIRSRPDLELVGTAEDGRVAIDVKTHLQNLYEKLGVSDRAAAAAEGMRRGLLE